MSEKAKYLRVRHVMELYGVGKGKVYEAIGRGQLPAVKLDRCVLIPVEAVEAWIGSAIPVQPKQG